MNQIDKKRKLQFFASAETHNSPRFGYNNLLRKKQFWLLLNLLPNGMPFIHQGFELNEWVPVNTGLNISKNLHQKLINAPLPLFNKTSLNWITSKNIIAFIQGLNSFRQKYRQGFNIKTETVLMNEKEKLVVLKKIGKTQKLFFVFNFDTKKKKSLPISSLAESPLSEYDIEKMVLLNSKLKKTITLPPSGYIVLINVH